MSTIAISPKAKQFQLLAPFVLSSALSLQGAAAADLSGLWETTGLNRVDVTPLRAPSLIPQHTVEIADSTYQFSLDGSFVSGEIPGSWSQKRNTYAIRADRTTLENLFRQSIENQQPEPGQPPLVVNELRLLSGKLSGRRMDNGIWGEESYVYRIDTSRGSQREVMRVAITVHVAGTRPAPTAALSGAGTAPMKTVTDIAAAAVVNYWRDR